MRLTLRVWRQRDTEADGAMSTYEVDGISPDMSFLEMLDTLNEELILRGDDPVAFDHDCREGICGACSLVINGDAHGPERTTTCQLHMRSFQDGDTIDVEPWRASAFPVIKDRRGPVGVRPDHPGRRVHHRADRSTTRSLITGNADALHGSMSIVSPSWKDRMCN